MYSPISVTRTDGLVTGVNINVKIIFLSESNWHKLCRTTKFEHSSHNKLRSYITIITFNCDHTHGNYLYYKFTTHPDSLSNTKVTGPSFSIKTCIIAPNTPVSTFKPLCRNFSTNLS